MKKTYLGRLWLHWCTKCNLPVLDETCARCGESTKWIEVTPPGDVRPGFKYDVELINRITTQQFNKPLVPPDRLVVLNRAPYDDRMDEVIFDAQVMGAMRFEIETRRWVFLPRLEGAARLFNTGIENMRGWVVVDEDAAEFIRGGASVLSPGVISADEHIKVGDEVVVLTPEGGVVACGRARMGGEEMCRSTRGVAVKSRWHGTPDTTVPVGGGQSWSDALSANQHVMEQAMERAVRFIRNVADSTAHPVAVSYSGGKDSLATLLLALDAGVDFDLLFADTGIEFPETLENVREVSARYQLRLLSISAGEAFWDSVEYFGPPSLETRWCCKLCKLGPITQLIETHYPGGCLTFIGQRKYESSNRARSEHVWRNPWMGNQIAASPIQNWTALHVWLYLFSKEAPYNPLYEEGFHRIGCWPCPASNMSELLHVAKTHPRLWERYAKVLHAHAERLGLKKEWVEYHLWRWQRPPGAHRRLAEKLGITPPSVKTSTPRNYHVASGHRPCVQGGVSVEAAFDTPLNLEELEKSGMLRILGSLSSMEGVIILKSGDSSTQIFASGNLTTRSKNEETALKLVRDVASAIKRALDCRGCGLCLGHCESGAVRIHHKRARVTGQCTACGKCTAVCPIIKFETGGVASE